MTTKDRHETSNLSIIDAVETLSNIADLDLNREVGIVQPHDITVQDKKIVYRTVHWLHRQDASETIVVVKDIFRVILKYLRNFYRKDYAHVTNPQTIEGIKTIMVLVGEAAKKLDKYSSHFDKATDKSVTELREYKQLQEFYLSRIARKIDEGTLGTWLLALTKRAWEQRTDVKLTTKKALQTKHVFVDLDSVKKDTEYELFFLRKEDGTRFYSPRLIRNIKLVCDFGDYFGKGKKEADPLEDILIWHDRCYLAAAKEILHAIENRLSRFFRESMRYKDRELVEYLNKAFIALMLCANPHNQIKNLPMKSCKDYFADFQLYLRSALHTRDYLKLITYPPKRSSKLAHCLLDTVHGTCMALIEHVHFYQHMSFFIQRLVRDAKDMHSAEHETAAKASHYLWSALASENNAMVKLLKNHSNGPLVKVLDVLQDGGRFSFDPLWMHNMPSQLYAISVNDAKIMNVQVPSPTTQEFIHKVAVTDEFKGFLRNCEKDHFVRKHLLINLQDRTSWREHFRCIALEELQKLEEFEKHLKVVTLAKDTEFYHQLAPYHSDNHADVFMAHLKEHLEDVNSGFYFPESIKKALFPRFVEGVIEAVHRIFFSGKNILLREHRMDFIEIFYMFLQLKLIELVRPDSFSLTCKDGVDSGASANAQLFLFLKLINKQTLTEAEHASLNQILYAPAVFVRERVIQPERFNRMLSAIKCVESVHNQFGESNFATIIHDTFGDFYKTPILQSRIILPKG